MPTGTTLRADGSPVRPGHRLPTSRPLAAVLLLIFLGAAPASADVIILKNGNKIRGKLKAEVGDLIEFELPYGTMRIRRNEIEKIERESDADYLEKAGRNLLRHKDLAKGIEFLRRAHAKSPSPSTRQSLVAALRMSAEKAVSKRRLEAAQGYIAEALDLDDTNGKLLKTRDSVRAALEKLVRLETRAEAALVEQKVDVAYESVRQLVEEYPERRDRWRSQLARLSVVKGHSVLRDSKFAHARDLYHEALANDPDLIEYIRVPLGFCEIQAVIPVLENGNFDQARVRLTEASHVLPGNPAITYYLALTEQGAGNLSRAADLYSILAGPDNKTINNEKHILALKDAAESQLSKTTSIELPEPVQRWSSSIKKKGVLETRNFKIHYTIKDRAVTTERYLEHHFGRMRQRWFRGALPLRAKVDVFLHPSKEAFQEAVSPPSWSSGITRHEYRFGRCFSHEVHFDASAPQFLSSTLPHELCHVLIPALIGEEARAPLWLDEGLATTEEPEFKQRYYRRVVRDALDDGTFFPITDLFRMTSYPEEERAALFYAQSNSVTRFLITRLGLREALSFLRELATGPADQVTREHPTFTTLGHLEGSWRRWAEKDS